MKEIWKSTITNFHLKSILKGEQSLSKDRLQDSIASIISVCLSSFFPCRYYIYSLSFIKALTEIAMRLNSTNHSLHASVSLNVFIVLRSIITCIKCQLSSSLFSRLLFNKSLT